MRGIALIDIIRYLVLCEISISIGFTMAIMIKCQMSHNRRKKHGEARRVGDRQMFAHIWVTGTALILFSLGTAAEIGLRLGEPATWLSPFVFIIGTVGATAQGWAYVMWSRE